MVSSRWQLNCTFLIKYCRIALALDFTQPPRFFLIYSTTTKIKKIMQQYQLYWGKLQLYKLPALKRQSNKKDLNPTSMTLRFFCWSPQFFKDIKFFFTFQGFR